METLIKFYYFTLDKPEVVSAYATIGSLVLTGIIFVASKTTSDKKVFKQKGGANSKNIQGEKVEVAIYDNLWK